MRRRSLLGCAAAAAALLSAPHLIRRAAAADESPGGEVDVLLLLAVDVSRSMDEEEAKLQREGYIAALHDGAVHDAIEGGAFGAIGLAYFEWSGPEHQKVVVPWTRVGGAAHARAFAGRLRAAPLGIGTWTSISAALDHARAMMAAAPFAAERHVVDVSGDGTNNSGAPVEEARDRAVDAGITINGLPVMKDPPLRIPGAEPVRLDAYYREQVVGGFGAFVVPAEDFRDFGPAVRRKLILEIVDLRRGAPAALG
jgi:hypothetical protein